MDNSGFHNDNLDKINGDVGFLKPIPKVVNGRRCNEENKHNGVGTEEVDVITGDVENQLPKNNGDRLVTHADFAERFTVHYKHSVTLKQKISEQFSKRKCSTSSIKYFLFSILPCVNIIRNYNFKEDVIGDIVGGLTVGIMHIPQGMAYAMLATLPPVYGLYTSFFPVLVYFFFGSSKHISLGTASVPCLMIGTAITKGIDGLSISKLVTALPNITLGVTGNFLANQSETTTTTRSVSMTDDSSEMSPEELDLRLQFAMSVTFMVGVIQLLMSILRLGFITVYMSDALISGFTTGVACHVFTSQIKNIFNIKLKSYSGVFKLIYTYRDFFKNISATNYITVVISLSSIFVLYCVSRFINRNPRLQAKMFMPIPIELLVVILGTVVSYFLNLEQSYNVAVVSDIPTGLPMANSDGFKRLSWSLLTDAFPIVIVIFSISISIAKSLAKKHNYEVNANQELFAFGMSSVVCSFMSSVAPMAALSRAVVGDRVGVKTQVAGLVSCCLLIVVLYLIGPYFKTTPKCVLASIIVVSLQAMFLQILDLKRIYRQSKVDFIVWLVTFISTVLLDVDLGLLVAIATNLVTVIYRAQRPSFTVLGQLAGTRVYRDISVYSQAEEVQGIKILRYESPLIFLNKQHFRASLFKLVTKRLKIANNRKKRDNSLMTRQEKNDLTVSVLPSTTDREIHTNNVPNVRDEQELDLHTLILDCSSWNYVDSSGISVLSDVISEYRRVGIGVLLTNCKDSVLETFYKTKFYTILDKSDIYLTLDDAVTNTIYKQAPSERL